METDDSLLTPLKGRAGGRRRASTASDPVWAVPDPRRCLRLHRTTQRQQVRKPRTLGRHSPGWSFWWAWPWPEVFGAVVSLLCDDWRSAAAADTVAFYLLDVFCFFSLHEGQHRAPKAARVSQRKCTPGSTPWHPADKHEIIHSRHRDQLHQSSGERLLECISRISHTISFNVIPLIYLAIQPWSQRLILSLLADFVFSLSLWILF